MLKNYYFEIVRFVVCMCALIFIEYVNTLTLN